MRMIALIATALFLTGAMQTAPTDKPKTPEPPKMPEASQESAWLQQFTGDWTFEAEMNIGPDQPPMKSAGAETARMIGGIWLMAEGTGKMPDGSPMTFVLTLGYDPEKKKYVGTWIGSMMSHLWIYAGTLDSTGKILTLETDGPDMADPAKTAKYRDVHEFKSKDHRTLTSSVLGADGKWLTFSTVNYRRKAP